MMPKWKKSIIFLIAITKKALLRIIRKFKSLLNVKDAYSKTITWLKILIPSFIALSLGFFIIILTFDFSNTVSLNLPKIDPKMPIVFNVKSLTLNGIDEKNNTFSIFLNAAEELPNENKIKVVNLNTKIEFNDKEWLGLKSENALFNRKTSVIELQNNVEITDYAGDIITGKNMQVDMINNEITSNEFVDIKSSFGNIQSDQGFYIKRDEVYKFKGKVKAKIKASAFKDGIEPRFTDVNLPNFKTDKSKEGTTNNENKAQ